MKGEQAVAMYINFCDLPAIYCVRIIMKVYFLVCQNMFLGCAYVQPFMFLYWIKPHKAVFLVTHASVAINLYPAVLQLGLFLCFHLIP
jgi:hypothetical protein